MIGRNDDCWCGSRKKWKKCHFPNEGPKVYSVLSNLKKEYFQKYQIILKNEKQIQGIKDASNLAAKILDATCALAKAGVTTEELNQFAHKKPKTKKRKALLSI